MEGNKKLKQIHEKWCMKKNVALSSIYGKNMFFKSEEFQNSLDIVEEKNMGKAEKHKLNGALVWNKASQLT